MVEVIKTVNIAGAALITQISIISIMFVGALIIHIWENVQNSNPRFYSLGWIILLFSIITLLLMMYSDEFSELWKPIFKTSKPTLLKWSSAIFIMFVSNIICVTILVFLTGGSATSPFSPIYFLMPALAIFFREPINRIVYYLVLVSAAYTMTMFVIDYGGEKSSKKFALWIVSISCFCLATYVGIITRP